MKEHDLQCRIVRMLRLRGCVVICSDMMISLMFLGKHQNKRIGFINYAYGQGYTKGQSDLIVIKDGTVYFVEVKCWSIGKNGRIIGKTKQSPEQVEFQRKIEEQGLEYILIDSPEKEDYLYSLIK